MEMVFFRHRAAWESWTQTDLELKIDNSEALSVPSYSYEMAMGREDGNLFKGIGTDKKLLKKFADYFTQFATEEQLGIVHFLFERASDEEPLFYQAMKNDKIMADIYLKMLAHAEEHCNFQSLVIRDISDF